MEDEARLLARLDLGGAGTGQCDANLQGIRLAQLEQPLTETDPAAGEAFGSRGDHDSRNERPNGQRPLFRGHAAQPSGLGRPLGLDSRRFVGPARGAGLASRASSESTRRPDSSVACSSSRSRTCTSGMPASTRVPSRTYTLATIPLSGAVSGTDRAGMTENAPVTVMGRGMIVPAHEHERGRDEQSVAQAPPRHPGPKFTPRRHTGLDCAPNRPAEQQPHAEHEQRASRQAQRAVEPAVHAAGHQQHDRGDVPGREQAIDQEDALLALVGRRHRDVEPEHPRLAPPSQVREGALAEVGHLEPVAEREVAVQRDAADWRS